MVMTRFLCSVIAPALVLGALMATAVSWADVPRVHPSALERFGGTWSSDCDNPRAPRVTVSADALVFEASGERSVGREVFSGYSYYGPSSPENFIVRFFSSRGEFDAYQSDQGDFLSVQSASDRDGHGPDVRQLDFRQGTRLFHCDAERRAASVALYEASQAAQAAAEAEEQEAERARWAMPIEQITDPTLLLKRDPVFAKAYRAAMAGYPAENWLTTLEGVGSYRAQPTQTIAGVEYLWSNVCKPRDCGDNNLVLLYDRAGGKVHVALRFQGQRTRLLGNPPAAVANALNELWRDTWGN